MKIQNEVKDRLVKNFISKMEFLRMLLDLDQSTPDHENCYPNIEVMEDSKVKNIFEASAKNTKYNYYHYLTIFISANAKNYIENANKLGTTLEKIAPNEDPLFEKYILGTFFYINSDIENLRIVIDGYEKGDKNDITFSNINVLKRLHNGLLSNKSVDYRRDC